MVLLDEGRVHLNGRFFSLTHEAHKALMEGVIASYEAKLQDEIASLRMEYGMHPAVVEATSMRPSNVVSALVSILPGEGPQEVPALQGHPSTQDVQPVPRRAPRKRSVPILPGSEAGTGTSSPPA